MTYLADWRSSITRGRQITDVTWVFASYGPFAQEIRKSLELDPRFRFIPTVNELGKPKRVVEYSGGEPRIADDERKILNEIIHITEVDWDELTKLVYSTYPILMSERNGSLDLPALASEYMARKEDFSRSG